MAANAYLRIGRLATHPAFSARDGCVLVCPICGGEPEQFRTTRVAAYDRHFVAHDPSAADAERFMSGRSFERLAIARGWVDACAGSRAAVEPVADWPWSTPRAPRYAPCPVCGETAVRDVRGRLRAHLARGVRRG
jgi:hypothetical protein